jgi:uncharacterized membrane protein YhaH (DUF805 family)
MDWKWLFTSFQGRTNRQPFWLGLLALIIAEWVVMLVLSMVFGVSMMGNVDPNAAPGQAPAMASGAVALISIVALIFIWPALAIYTKRWHDRDKSGWWTLISLVPVIGSIWMLVECGFLRGTEGPNRFGADPLAGK